MLIDVTMTPYDSTGYTDSSTTYSNDSLNILAGDTFQGLMYNFIQRIYHLKLMVIFTYRLASYFPLIKM
jgi:hypothetical protein